MRRIAGREYRNPVHPGYLADPFVLSTTRGYFAYGTSPSSGGRAFQVLHSEDLISWTSLGGALETMPGNEELTYWAPEVAYDGSRYLMYYSAGIGDRGHLLRVAAADLPEGPFRDLGKILESPHPFAIDPHPFRDDDGQVYLFFATDFLDGERPGTALAVDRLLHFDQLEGDPVTVLRASADWQLFERQREMYGQVLDWYTLEGPFVVKRGDLYYCFYSGGNWQNPSYGVSYAVAEHPLGPWREPDGEGPALLRSGGRSAPNALLGPGHNSVVEGPDGEDYLVFHSWNQERNRRQMWIERLEWNASGPRVCETPSAGLAHE